MRRCVIVGNADIAEYDFIRGQLRSDDYFVFCDGGTRHAKNLRVTADFIVGDFDSGELPNGENIHVLPQEKDDTDTFAAARLMCGRGFSDFILIGCFGNRLDHTLCNVSVLIFLQQQGKTARVFDDYGTAEVLAGGVAAVIPKNSCKYFSVIALSKLEDVHINGAKFPLCGAEVDWSHQYAISNEPVNDVTIKFERGTALLIKIR